MDSRVKTRLERLAQRALRHGVRVGLLSLWDVENNAVRILAAEVRRRGHVALEVYFKDWVSNHLDPASEAELDALVRVLREREVQLLALSVRASAYREQAALITRTVQQRLGIPVLWGGMHPTLVPSDGLAVADLILRGEAELALGELTDRLAAGEPFLDTPNLGWLDDLGLPQLSPLRPLVQDLDTLPFRDYTTDDHKVLIRGPRPKWGDPMRGDPTFQMMSSRGCIYQCSYCYNSTYKRDIYPGQRWYRTRSVSSTLAEIEAARAHWPFKRVRFDDEVFNTRPDWLDEFCARWPVEVGLPFEVFLEPKLITRERLTKLKQAGMVGVFMGIQASARVSVELYEREAEDEAIEDVVQLMHEVGVYPHLQLIWDDPASTEEDWRRVFEMVQSFPRPYDLYLFSLTIFPTSSLDAKLDDSGTTSRWDVEGDNVRTFFQHRVNLKYPRRVEETFWIALCILSANPHLPKALLEPLSRSERLKRHPWPLIQLAHAATYYKLGSTAARMTLRGEMTLTLIRRWLSADRIITS